jgi:aminoglycoside 3-N-acetyltransferase
MIQSPYTTQEVTQQLLDLGVKAGQLLLVHCAFSKVKPVEEGPRGLVNALLSVLGPEGTLVMPSMPDRRDEVFDPQRTPCTRMGVVANLFWQLPHVYRSDNPHAFAAYGSLASEITATHPIDIPHGLDSPVGRVYQHDGMILLLGVGHDDNTSIHLAESLAQVRYRRRKRVLLRFGQQTVMHAYDAIDHCCAKFQYVDAWLTSEKLQRMGPIGYADARLMRARDVVNVVRKQLEENEVVFLHPRGTDSHCDEAWESLDTRRSAAYYCHL